MTRKTLVAGLTWIDCRAENQEWRQSRPFLSIIGSFGQRVAKFNWARVSRGRPVAHFEETIMAKALYGHVAVAPDRRLLDEVTRLRATVRALEFEVARLRAENDRLAAAVAEAEGMLRLTEPALT